MTSRQTNEQGQVAMKYHQPANRVLVEDAPSGNPYVFVVKASITLAWVDPGDVEYLLSRRGGCCDSYRQLFKLANESDVRRWTNGGGR